ncbi:SLC13 family permease [Cellulosimicrobium cellulans]|uniref:SLC13 family permease n=1 Tax=Cellulosimicrobium cellulans TaxID=1710 RepID=UPI001FCB9453|nr:SLC13 family permease [Cellulosimicrobium cellulans]
MNASGAPARRRVPLWLVAAVVVVVLPATGLLPATDARELLVRTGPVLVFLLAITVVAELCAGAGLFDAVAARAARLARGRRIVLWGLVVVLATASTVVLSLDTTAVLVTPVVLALARRTGTRPLPLALTVLALANTASLLLPVSNLTNLLAAHRFGTGYVAVMWAPALAVLTVTVVVLLVLHGRDLRGRFTLAGAGPTPPDRLLLRLTAAVVVLLAVAFALEIPVAPTALAGAAVLALATWWRRVRPLVPVREMLPWRSALIVAALFVLVETWHAHGLGDLLATVAGTGDGPGDLAQLAATGVVAANLVNNLPAFLALLPAAGESVDRLATLLVAVNAGPLITPWASLATVLWWQQYRRHAFEHGPPPAWHVVRQGLVLAPLAVAAGVAVVALG